MEEKLFTFHGILAELRTLKVEPKAGEVINGEGIYLIYMSINVVAYQHLLQFTKYLILILFYFKTH
jgi:hypothetical protein